MKYRHKGSGKTYSSDEMAKMKMAKGYKADDYEECPDSEKSDLTEDELRKSCEELEALARSGDRKGQLLEKAQSGELDEKEREELYRILGGGDEGSLAGTVTKGLQPDADDDLAKALDVSDYLNAQHRALVGSLEQLSEHVEKGGQRQHEFNVVLAKSLVASQKAILQQGEVLKSIANRLGVIEQQPARQPKSQLNKSEVVERQLAGGQPGEGEQLTKSDVSGVLSSWIQSGRKTSDSGESLLVASSKFEQFNMISPSLKAEVERHLAGQKNGAVH